MRYIVIGLMCFAVLGAANTSKLEKAANLKAERIARLGNPEPLSVILSEQPDTIYYDDGNPTWGYSGSDLWGAVRFTPLSDFDLRVIYTSIYNIGATDPETLYFTIVDTLGSPRDTLGGPYAVEIPPQGWWNVQVDLPDTFSFTAGTDFYIIEGPQLGFDILGIDFDAATVTFRSWVDFGDGTFINEDGGDITIRAGGQYALPYTDLASICTFNNLNKFFILDGEDVYLMATLKNVGTDTIDSWQQYFFVRDTFGAVYFSDVVSGGTLNPGDEVTVTSTQPWAAFPGYFIAIDSAVTPGDNEPTNDVTMMELRPYDPATARWFSYTDMSAEACYSWTVGNKWATGFLLNCYPVTLDTIAIAFSVSPDTIALDVPFEVWWGMDMPESLLVAATIDTVFGGYIHLIYFDPAITVDSGMIFIAYPYYVDGNGNSVCLFQDQTPPRAGSNLCVDVTTFQWFVSDSIWHEDNSGDWFMWAFFSECALHPYDCGDVNGNGVVGYDDLTYLASYLFAGGPPPLDMWTADVNCNGVVGYDDLTYLASYLFAGGPPPDCCN